MADKKSEKKTADKNDSSKPADAKISIWMWGVVITVVTLLSASGFVLGRLLAGSAPSEPVNTSLNSTSQKGIEAKPASLETNQGIWYYNDLESIVVNPNEPGATRFIRVGLILEMSEESNQEQANGLIKAKTPLLVNRLNLYFKSLSLNEMENEKDLNRILAQICDAFNEILFPDAAPQIKRILIREFNIQ